jgi:hypothetical protein
VAGYIILWELVRQNTTKDGLLFEAHLLEELGYEAL